MSCTILGNIKEAAKTDHRFFERQRLSDGNARSATKRYIWKRTPDKMLWYIIYLYIGYILPYAKNTILISYKL